MTLLPKKTVYVPRYGTTAEIAAATSPINPDSLAREVAVDIMKAALVVMNRGAPGGIAMAREDLDNVDPATGRTRLNVDVAGTAAALIAAHLAAGDPHPQYITAGELAAALAPYLPSDADLVAIANLATLAYGRSLLTLADKYALRASAGLKLGLGLYDLRPNWARHKSNGVADPHGILNLVAEDFIGDANGKPGFASFTRTSAATCFDPTGKLISCVSGVLRHDFDPLTGEYLGWLIEAAGTNLTIHSEAADNAAWTKTNATVTANAGVAPDGAVAADKIVEASDVAQSHNLTQAVVFTAAAHCFSVYLKAAGRNAAMVQLDSVTPSNAFFDLAAGTVGDIGGALTSASIKACGNGWYRCIVTGATAAATRNIRITPSSGSANGSETYNGDGASGILVWGAQVEVGSSPSSYITTAASQVTRAADVLTVPVSAFSFNPAGGTIFVDFRPAAAGVQTEIVRLYDGVSGGLALYRKASNVIAWNFGGQEASQIAVVAGQRSRVVACYSGAGDSLVIDGGAVNAKIDSAVPAGITTLALSGAAGGGLAQIGGHLRHVACFPRKLVAAELQDVTR